MTPPVTPSDFPATRRLIEQLPEWVDAFAACLSQPERVKLKLGFRWEHGTKDADLLQVAKAVRIASGLRAALILVDARHTVECGAMLRMISDFSAEILFLGEGLMEGRFTTEQRAFVEQNFDPLPASPEELAEREREYYIGRRAMAKAQDRMMDKVGGPKELLKKTAAFLNKGYDGFVHGTYPTTMELFTGATMSFMMRGSESPRQVCATKTAVAGKLQEALVALRFMAMTRGMNELAATMREASERLDRSGEDAGLPCQAL